MRKHPIYRLIEQGEHQQQDFKFAINDAKKIARTLVAFANSDGGRLLVGVKDNGSIAGVRSDEELHMIEMAMQMYTRPKVKCNSKLWIVDGKTVVEIAVEKGGKRPYFAPDETGKWTAYTRHNDNNILTNKLLVKSWKQQKSQKGVLIKLNHEHIVLIDMLKHSKYATIEQFYRAAGITLKLAEDIVVDLMALNLIGFDEIDSKTYYYLKETSGDIGAKLTIANRQNPRVKPE